jgi:hypothetical protein
MQVIATFLTPYVLMAAALPVWAVTWMLHTKKKGVAFRYALLHHGPMQYYPHLFPLIISTEVAMGNSSMPIEMKKRVPQSLMKS